MEDREVIIDIDHYDETDFDKTIIKKGTYLIVLSYPLIEKYNVLMELPDLTRRESLLTMKEIYNEIPHKNFYGHSVDQLLITQIILTKIYENWKHQRITMITVSVSS